MLHCFAKSCALALDKWFIKKDPLELMNINLPEPLESKSPPLQCYDSPRVENKSPPQLGNDFPEVVLHLNPPE